METDAQPDTLSETGPPPPGSNPTGAATAMTSGRDYRFAYRDYAEALYDALAEDAFYRTMEQSVSDGDQRREALLRYLDYSMREAKEYGRYQGARCQCSSHHIYYTWAGFIIKSNDIPVIVIGNFRQFFIGIDRMWVAYNIK